jgi:endonuclease/exonuclease/phosphatase family metal-dependent hydrolase
MPMRVATYNIKHCGVEGPEAVASVLRSIDADLAGLQEVDAWVDRSGRVDQAALLAAGTDRHVAFGPAFDYGGGAYGVALLSRWPIRTSETVALPSLVEPRALLLAEIDAPDGPLTAAVTHFGLDPRERIAQARTVASLLRGRRRALLFGDFNASLGERAMELLGAELADCASRAGAAPLRTYPAHAPTIGIDHVWLGGGWGRPLAVRAVASLASDHLPVVVDLG